MTTAQTPLARALSAPGVVGLRRSDSGEIVPLTSAQLRADAVAARRRTSIPGVSSISAVEPVHLLMRDAATNLPSGFLRDLREEVPDAAAVLDDYRAGRVQGFEALQRADAAYVKALETWGRGYVNARRGDADTVYLHLETVFVMQRVLEVMYAMPTIGNAIPREVLGTVLETWTQISEEETEEIAQIGDSWGSQDAPTVAPARGEKARRLKFFKAGVLWTDREVEVWQEARRNSIAPMGDIIGKKVNGAARAMARTAALIEAHGLHFDSAQIPGLLYGADEVRDTAAGIPVDEAEFCDLADPVATVEALNEQVRAQQAAVSYREDKIADSIAIDPATGLALAQLIYNSANASNVTAWDIFLMRNPQIRRVTMVRELRHDSTAIARLQKVGLTTAEATRCAGGFRETGGQMRSAGVLYRYDATKLSLVTGRQLETRTFPPNRDRHEAVMRQSSGGAIAYEPKTARIFYRPTAGDPTP